MHPSGEAAPAGEYVAGQPPAQERLKELVHVVGYSVRHVLHDFLHLRDDLLVCVTARSFHMWTLVGSA